VHAPSVRATLTGRWCFRCSKAAMNSLRYAEGRMPGQTRRRALHSLGALTKERAFGFAPRATRQSGLPYGLFSQIVGNASKGIR
jgi:hypothetical protein